MARPRKEIDKDLFEKLCALQCTEADICDVLDVTDKTLSSWCKRTYHAKGFSEVYEKKRKAGKISLRRMQFKLAEKSASMAIWLGKQYLGQTDQKVGDSHEQTADPLSLAFEDLLNPGSVPPMPDIEQPPEENFVPAQGGDSIENE